MTLHTVKKLVIITEKMIATKVCASLEDLGASGYTTVAAGGKGSRNVRSMTERASVIDDFSNVKIETIIADEKTAEEIMRKIAEQHFENYSGITYIEDVQILRPAKF